MDVAVSKRAESLELTNRHLESDVWIGVSGGKRHSTKINYLTAFFHAIEFYPSDVVVCRVGVRYFFAYGYSNDFNLFSSSPINFNHWNMLFFPFSLFAFPLLVNIVICESSPTSRMATTFPTFKLTL